MVYTRNQPVATDDLDISQPFLLNNTNSADDSFGVDHYKFSDTTINNGFHKTVTTPIATGSVHPTTAANPKLYAMQDSANIGLLQYSKGPNDAVPTPLTTLQSPATPITLASLASTPILDFTGIGSSAVAIVYAENVNISGATSAIPFNVAMVTYRRDTGPTVTKLSVASISSQGGPGFSVTGSTLNLVNNSGATLDHLFWTIQFLRIIT